MSIQQEDVVGHFVARAPAYNRSSAWCTDDELGALTVDAAQPVPTDRVLDVACGTGLVSRLFKGVAAHVTGLDITREMANQALPHLDKLIMGRAESMPFETESFDVTVSRQGIQFMVLPEAVQEMVRVIRPGGRVVLVNLCAYGAVDRDEYFEILRLRNPARRNFFVPEDLDRLLRDAGCNSVTLRRYVSAEDVDVWSDHRAIDDAARSAIRAIYQSASPEFAELHAVQEEKGRLVDHMLFVIAVGHKR